MESKIVGFEFPKRRRPINKEAIDFIIGSLEVQLSECLSGTETEIRDKAHTLIVSIDANALDLNNNRRLNSHFKISLLDLYDYLIIHDTARFCAVMKNLLHLEKKVYAIDVVDTNHLVYLLNKWMIIYKTDQKRR